MNQVGSSTNLHDVIEEAITKANGVDVDIKRNQIICDGQVKASLLVADQYVVEIIENELAHFTKGSSRGQKGKSLRARGRHIEDLVKQFGYSGYSCLSFVELEQSADE
jgi:hypothetical protein